MSSTQWLARVEPAIEAALREDLGSGDLTSLATVPDTAQAEGTFWAKSSGVVAGLMVAERVFHRLDPSVRVHWTVSDGARIEAGTAFGFVRGPARSLLAAERTALNFLQRMSGIATRTRAFVEAVLGTKARILDTRKTAPGLRWADKWAVRLGGGENHRMGLYDQVLIKNNHIAAAGGLEAALYRCREYLRAHGLEPFITVEARTLEEVDRILHLGGVHRILLDNMDPEGLREAVARVAGRLETEASGNVTLENVRAIAETGVDYISVGALTHSAPALDLSLELRLLPRSG
ncbi:MAG: carboxylating nicotinate-nucleotide diphosphorylase [Bacteroidetes bacterium]|nr:carboxylating nicotinate-nucleotide diphosphorylase [Rhodothermia bacterium]MCS7154808.1 carboxylating nicotinate-nucleotide diphosphorylase [Bacteroidota bacterium]MCX7907035.1 carboxylating nicotinate-nucleotide diphosphorylase [Bacteroidota bacterium]MDW8137601.1 carboxylating nicotinate-nucleotide diphosphorylase [Bacteroidota bacterium]MDW8285445.1 carboxylating nicotinate-nucleotide diphosphorylase [Bacteroidota bacterium]